MLKNKILITAVALSAICMSCSIDGSGYDVFVDSTFFVKQGSGQCGPTSFYMIFRYYGDNAYAGNFGEMPDCPVALDLQEELDTVTQDSGVSAWLGVTDSGINVEDLHNKISNLGNSDCSAYYSVDGNTDNSLNANNAEMSHIVEDFIDRERPVIIHLERANPLYSGHYIVLVGFDPAGERVYYVDPNKNDEDPVVQSVSISAFLGSAWYRSPDYDPVWYPIPDAYWDGTWVGFYRSR
ncbi:MAG TPA: C39 family peptidase [Spirochaetota bacterium]|nr:C39 family peptidase [Spirochaetota bacterium]HSA15356.1 C39 family peptidase [Spirochaetota bacterium]